MDKKHIALFFGLGILIAFSCVNFFLWLEINKQIIVLHERTNVNAFNNEKLVEFINSNFQKLQNEK